MSYILDALRKSEQERQVAAGRGAGMLFPVATETRPGIGRRLVLLIALALALTVGLNWWSWSRLSAPAKPPQASTPPALSAVPHTSPTPAPTAIPTPPPAPVQPLKPPAVAPPEPIERKPAAGTTSQKPTALPEKPVRIVPPAPAQPPVAEQAAPREASGASPKGLPNVSVSGFIRDEATGNMAIINDKLVREGEEVFPGLRLEKIDGEQAVLNYKGQRFRR